MDVLAITSWDGIVSPVFDAAGYFIIIKKGGEREVVGLVNEPLPGRIERLVEKKVAIVICGAISNDALHLLSQQGIKVLPWLRGPVEEVVEAYRKGQIPGSRYSMPGCHRNRCAHRRRRGFYGREDTQ